MIYKYMPIRSRQFTYINSHIYRNALAFSCVQLRDCYQRAISSTASHSVFSSLLNTSDTTPNPSTRPSLISATSC